MSYQLYRNTTLGHTLQESLDELIQVHTEIHGKCKPLKSLRFISHSNGKKSLLSTRLVSESLKKILPQGSSYSISDLCGQIPPPLALKILLQFDKVINTALAGKIKARLTFKAGHLETYRFCDNVWTFVLKDVDFREVQELIRVDKVKIVACDGKEEKKT